MNKLIETVCISEELLKVYSPIPLNYKEQKLYSFIILAQDDLKKLIGKEIVDDLRQKIEDNTLNAYDEALLVKIAPYMAATTCFYALPNMAYKITEKGVTKENSENSSSADIDEISWVIQRIKNQAEKAAEMLLTYLCDCKELYPLFVGECGCGNKVRESKLIYIPTRDNKCCGCK